MENKINIANLLRNCPKGMEIDCVMYQDVYFDYVDTLNIIHCYIQHETHKSSITFNQFGTLNSDIKSKCVIFPKGKNTWEGFVSPHQFKDGDIVISTLGNIAIISNTIDNKFYNTYCGFYEHYHLITHNIKICVERFATEEERQKLFDAIKDNGYHWNNETKILEELPKFKDGDVVVAEDSESQLFLLKKYLNKDSSSHDGYCYFGWDFQNNTLFEKGNWRFDRLATKEEREKLFQTIKDNGYRWDEKNKTLEKLPIFKVGNKIRHKENKDDVFKIDNIDMDNNLYCCGRNYIQISYQDKYELVPDKFDVTTLKPFESKVLVRNKNYYKWEGALFGRYDGNTFFTLGGIDWKYCIPYEGNEHLHGTTNSCDDYFKTWKDE